MRRRKAAAWILIAAFLLALVTVPARAASSSEIRKQIQALQEQKKEIETQIARVKAEYQGNRDEIGELMARKQVLDQEVNLLAAGIRNLNEQILAYSVLIADKQEELDRAQERYEDLREQSNQRIRAMEDQIFFFRQQVFGMTAVTLPAVSRFSFASTRNRKTATAVRAKTTARNVIHQHAVALFKMAAALPHRHNLPARFMTVDKSLV